MMTRVFLALVSVAVMLLALIAVVPRSTQIQAGQPDANARAAAVQRFSNCRVVLDTSGSVVGLAGIWHDLREQLPAVLTVVACEYLEIHEFGRDGWTMRRMLRVKMPPHWSTMPLSVEVAPEFKAFVSGVVASEEQKKRAKAMEEYRQAVSKVLLRLDSISGEVLMPKKSSCSDVAGALRRLTAAPDAEAVLMISDFNNTCGATMARATSPVPGLLVIAIIAPASDMKMSPAEQYELRRREIKEIAGAGGWVVTVPPYTPNLERYFRRP